MIYALGLLVALVGSSIAVAPPLADAFGLVKLAVASIGALLLWVRCCPARFRATGIEAPLFAFLAAFFFSMLLSVDSIVSIVGIYTQPYYGTAALIPAVLIYYAVSSEGDRWTWGVFYCAALIGIANGAACALQLAGIDLGWQGLVGYRAVGLIGSPPFMGALMAPCLPAALWLSGRGSWIGWAGAIGAFLSLTAAWSRGPWIAAAAGLWAFLAASGTVRPRLRHYAAAAAILAALAAASGAMGKTMSDAGRIAVWKVAARAGIDKPIAGWGPDTFPLAMRQLKTPASARVELQASAHNDLLQAWATLGLPGLLALVWLWAAVLRLAWRESVFWRPILGDNEAPAVFGALVTLFVAAKFNPIQPPAVYLVAALAGSLTKIGPARPPRAAPLLWSLGIVFWIATVLSLGHALTAEALFSSGAAHLKRGELRIGADRLREANELYPFEIAYASKRCELIWKIAWTVPPGKRKDFAKRTLRAAAEVVKAHPLDSSSYELMSTAELWAAPMFGPGLSRAAVRSSRRAVELDPLFEFSAMRWAQASNQALDRREFELAKEHLLTLRRLKP